jgi:hypothetical protein
VKSQIDSNPEPRGAMSVKVFCAWAGIGATKFYQEVNEGRLHPRKIGRKPLIAYSEAVRWLNSLPALETRKAA